MPRELAVCFHAVEWVCGICGKCPACCSDKRHLGLIHTASKSLAEIKMALFREEKGQSK